MKIFYGKAVYDKKEIQASINVLKNKSFALIDGPSVKELERKIAKSFGKKYGLMVNSGSSANLLALASLNLNKGSEIITPTLTFSTTIAPMYQLGLVPHFIDVEKNSFVARTDQILKAINKKTGARGLRSILENILLKTMYDLPSNDNVEEVIVDLGAAKGVSQPIIVHSKNNSKTKTDKTSAA